MIRLLWWHKNLRMEVDLFLNLGLISFCCKYVVVVFFNYFD